MFREIYKTRTKAKIKENTQNVQLMLLKTMQNVQLMSKR